MTDDIAVAKFVKTDINDYKIAITKAIKFDGIVVKPCIIVVSMSLKMSTTFDITDIRIGTKLDTNQVTSRIMF